MDIRLKRVYDPPVPEDGQRVLVDRLWPRGLSKEQAQVHLWAKDLAPSDDLRRWFAHDPEKWQEFRRRYRQELRSASGAQPLLKELAQKAARQPVTLLFAAKDTQRNNAVVLKEVLEETVRFSNGDGISSFDTLMYIAARLRSPDGGCPWDRAQTHESIEKNFLQETYEAIQAIEERDSKKLCEELGDVLMQVALHSQFASEAGTFTIKDVLKSINSKLVRRHPHVFGDASASTPGEVEKSWEEIKKEEKQTTSVLDGVPTALPALAYSQEVQHRAARVGFEWDTIEGVWKKVQEELQEMREAKSKEELEHELGDIFTALVNIARWLGIDAESALRKANQRFHQRFTIMERLARERGLELRQMTLEQMDRLWEEAKEICYGSALTPGTMPPPDGGRHTEG